jgi:hypothetical protein
MPLQFRGMIRRRDTEKPAEGAGKIIGILVAEPVGNLFDQESAFGEQRALTNPQRADPARRRRRLGSARGFSAAM